MEGSDPNAFGRAREGGYEPFRELPGRSVRKSEGQHRCGIDPLGEERADALLERPRLPGARPRLELERRAPVHRGAILRKIIARRRPTVILGAVGYRRQEQRTAQIAAAKDT